MIQGDKRSHILIEDKNNNTLKINNLVRYIYLTF